MKLFKNSWTLIEGAGISPLPASRVPTPHDFEESMKLIMAVRVVYSHVITH